MNPKIREALRDLAKAMIEAEAPEISEAFDVEIQSTNIKLVYRVMTNPRKIIIYFDPELSEPFPVIIRRAIVGAKDVMNTRVSIRIKTLRKLIASDEALMNLSEDERAEIYRLVEVDSIEVSSNEKG